MCQQHLPKEKVSWKHGTVTLQIKKKANWRRCLIKPKDVQSGRAKIPIASKASLSGECHHTIAKTVN